MGTPLTELRWEHAHESQACGHVVRIDDVDAKVIATGGVTCQECTASGPVNVKIVDAQQISDVTQQQRAKRQ
jgi:hypothetical protein